MTLGSNLLKFEEVSAYTSGPKINLLLGNGFSRACRNDLFSYTALFDAAKEQGLLDDHLLETFDILGTDDFEIVMRALDDSARVYSVYAPDAPQLANRMRSDADTLRDTLAQVISANHPERANEIADAEFQHCRRFLRGFDSIYTLNYDLLLYWSLMQNDIDGEPMKCDDGFRQPEDGIEDYVEWTLDIQTQNIFYLHGALHIFDGGSIIQKYTWSNTGIALVDQIRDALSKNRYPIYVSEGSSKSKRERVLHNAFLIRGYRSLASLSSPLVIFGHSLSENDDHVLDCIERSRIPMLFISLFGDPNSPDNQRIVARGDTMASNRARFNDRRRSASPRSRPPELNVRFFDATSAEVWG